MPLKDRSFLLRELSDMGKPYYFLYKLIMLNLASRDYIMEQVKGSQSELFKYMPFNALGDTKNLLLYLEPFVRGVEIFKDSQEKDRLVFAPNAYYRSVSNRITTDDNLVMYLANFYYHVIYGKHSSSEKQIFDEDINVREKRILGDFLGFDERPKYSLEDKAENGGNRTLARALRREIEEISEETPDNTRLRDYLKSKEK
jgi:hypothetical protein